MPIRLGIVGVGKIARDQHLPTIAASDAFELVACASRHAAVDGVDSFPTLEAMLEGRPDVQAVAVCSPPTAHYAAARLALDSGRHVLLEKPPCATTAQLDDLEGRAQRRGGTLFQTWHSRHAAAVDLARARMAGRPVQSGAITWKEDVRHWHPGQHWVFEPGGFGVFDPGINALSILTRLLDEAVFVDAADLSFPQNLQAPIAAELALRTAGGAKIDVALDWRQTGPQSWDIELQAGSESLKLSQGGARLAVGGADIPSGADEGEYPPLYRRFAELIDQGASEVDGRPFGLVADAFLVGRRHIVEPFQL